MSDETEEHNRDYSLLYDFIRVTSTPCQGSFILRGGPEPVDVPCAKLLGHEGVHGPVVMPIAFEQELVGDDKGMTMRTKTTVAEGIVSREQCSSGAETFRYEYEPGNATRYEIWISAWEDNRAMVSLWPGVSGSSSCCVFSTDGYLHEDYVADKLGVGSVDALVLAEFLGHVLGRDAPLAGPVERVDSSKPGVVVEERLSEELTDVSEPSGTDRIPGVYLETSLAAKGVVPRQAPRPTFTSFEVSAPTLITSLQHAIETLGEDEGGLLESAFITGAGIRGIWALPHPEAGDDQPEFFVPVVSLEHAEALADWAREAEREGGCSGWGLKFDAAMKAARGVRDALER